MANLVIKDGNSAEKYLKASGLGTDDDPQIPEHSESNSASILTAIQAVETAVEGTIAVTGAVAATQSGTWNIGSVTTLPTVTVTGALTDTQLRASSVPVGGTVTATVANATIAGGTVVATGPLTDTELRATAVPIGGTVSATMVGGTVSVTHDALTELAAAIDTELQVDVVGSLPAGSAHIGAVGGHTAKPAATVTRPADTTAYAAGDVVNAATGAVITFSGCARANGLGGVIQHAKLVDSANQTTKGDFELWLFDTTFTPDNDNAAFTPTDAELATVVCVIDLSYATFVGDATAGDGGNVLHQSDVLNRAFTCETADTALYGALVVRNAYTPVSDETFAIQLEILQD